MPVRSGWFALTLYLLPAKFMIPTAPNTATALSLPRLTRNEAQARGLLAQRARSVEVTLGGVAWQLSLEPVSYTHLTLPTIYSV